MRVLSTLFTMAGVQLAFLESDEVCLVLSNNNKMHKHNVELPVGLNCHINKNMEATNVIIKIEATAVSSYPTS